MHTKIKADTNRKEKRGRIDQGNISYYYLGIDIKCDYYFDNIGEYESCIILNTLGEAIVFRTSDSECHY